MGITDLLLTLYTYLSLSTVYRKCNRREYRPVQNPLPLNLKPLTLLRTTTDLLIAFTDRYKTLRKPPTFLQTVTDLLTTFTEYYKTSATRYVLYYIVWQILVNKLIKVKRSGVRESTLRLRTALTTILILKSLNTDTLSF